MISNVAKNDIFMLDSEEEIFLQYLLNFKKDEASQYILQKVKNGTSIKEIYIQYIQASLYKIGELWQHQEISVAKEHYCTAVIQNIISLLYPYLFTHKIKKNRSLFAVSAGSELHEIGIRMVSDFFEVDGWDTFYLGSNIPISSIISELKANNANLLAISITMGNNIDFAVNLINEIRLTEILTPLKIIVGGKFFNETKDLWKKIGADGYGFDAAESVSVGNKLMEA